MRVVVTGAAGFIGSFVTEELLQAGHSVLGIDNLNGYYDPRLKELRLTKLRMHGQFAFQRVDVREFGELRRVIQDYDPHCIVHLAAEVGVRFSLNHPLPYAESNLMGTTHVLEVAREQRIPRVILASSSSAEGLKSFYAVTKRCNEMMAENYAMLHDMDVTALRFFTVYGPWGRPDMAVLDFTRRMLREEPLRIYGSGTQKRCFSFVTDVAKAVTVIALGPRKRNFRVYDVACDESTDVLGLVAALEKVVGISARLEFLPPRPDEMHCVSPDPEPLARDFGIRLRIPLEEGLRRFWSWAISAEGRGFLDQKRRDDSKRPFS